MHTSKIGVFTLTAVMMFNAAHAAETHAKLWLATAFTGSLSKDKKIKFYVEPNLRLIDDKYKFNEALVWMALGYQLSPQLVFFLGDTPAMSRNLKGVYSHRNIIWQQANWRVFTSDAARLVSRSRLQEVTQSDKSSWAIVLRERVQIKFPIKNWQRHSIILSDEMFFNLKSPSWGERNRFIPENRAYIGLGTQLSRKVSSSIGYLNQYEFADKNQMSNVLLLGLEVNFG